MPPTEACSARPVPIPLAGMMSSREKSEAVRRSSCLRSHGETGGPVAPTEVSTGRSLSWRFNHQGMSDSKNVARTTMKDKKWSWREQSNLQPRYTKTIPAHYHKIQQDTAGNGKPTLPCSYSDGGIQSSTRDKRATVTRTGILGRNRD
jgi:hypothetical protein